MPAKKIMFQGANGEELSAKLDSPEGEAKAYALFAHCFTCGKDLSAINRIAKALNEDEIALFRFDFTGIGASHGDFANTNFSSNVQDLIAAEKFMQANLQAPDIMIGHSLGGAATLVAAAHIEHVKAVVTIGAPFDSVNVLKQFGSSLEAIEEQGEVELLLAGRSFKIKKQFIDDAVSQNITDHIRNLKKPLLVMHSPVDDTVPIDHARSIYEAANHPKSFISLDKADHLLMKSDKYGQYTARVLAAWASQYIE